MKRTNSNLFSTSVNPQSVPWSFSNCKFSGSMDGASEESYQLSSVSGLPFFSLILKDANERALIADSKMRGLPFKINM